MPMHNECAALTFDSPKPRELSRYFEDLKHLMLWAVINTKVEKKKQVSCYVNFNTEQIWKTFFFSLEFINNSKTYEEFKEAILVYIQMLPAILFDLSGTWIYLSVSDSN